MGKRIINIAVIAHVDAGKSTLVDAFLRQGGVFAENEVVVDCIMDSNALERERGITIYSKNCSIEYKGVKINIIDTPGHADFSSEVERVIKTVDTAILLVDSSEGPMPQTRFVLKKTLELGLVPILFINKIDKKDERAKEVVDMVIDLFIDLEATDEQLDFPIFYGIAKEGIAKKSLQEEGQDLTPLFDTLLEHVKSDPLYEDKPLAMQIFDLAYDNYIGRLGIGRIYQGTLREGEIVSIYKKEKKLEKGRVSKIFTFQGLRHLPVKEAKTGDIAVVAGMPSISIGEVLNHEDTIVPMEMIQILKPILSMNFAVNSSPFSGKSGKYLTLRHIKNRLEKELEINVGLLVEEMKGEEAFKVSGRGDLHLSILLENMRREGYELSVSKPEVTMYKENGKLMEPMERVMIDLPETYAGTIISKLNQRRGRLINMKTKDSFTQLEYLIPTRGLLGFRSEFINDTRGEGTLVGTYEAYEEYQGPIPKRSHGVLVSMNSGVAMAYALARLNERATLFIKPGDLVYEGMIIGMNSRSEDLWVNPCKNKHLTNMRASGSEDGIFLPPPRVFTLEEALEFITSDSFVEVTPGAIRLRKKELRKESQGKGRDAR